MGALKALVSGSWVTIPEGPPGPPGSIGLPGLTGNNSSTMTTNGIRTTAATATAIAVVPIPVNTTVLIRAYIVARRTGGTAGTAGDGAGYQWIGTYRNLTNVVAIIGAASVITMESVAAYNVGAAIVGETVEIQVTGVAATTIDWKVFVNTYEVSVVA